MGQVLLLQWRRAVIVLALLASASYADEATQTNGSFSQFVHRDGRQLEVIIDEQFSRDARENLTAWIEYISEALRNVYGHWPHERWEIAIAPTAASGSDPIPWAQVHRSPATRVEFYTTANPTFDELRSAWTGYHEMAHLLIPYQGWGDYWFTEGLASYYQNVLQARVGLITEQQMWQKLYEGFQRGLAETRFNGRPLSDVSKNMRNNGGFMRVYWSGACYFLAADTQLRLQSAGALTLDDALAKLNACCGQSAMSVPEIVAKLDELNHVLVFELLYEDFVSATTFPSFDTLFASLGVRVVDGVVVLQQTGPGAQLRRTIVQDASQ
ncbi:MAG: hypothetical protein AAGF35_00795 [Pseudomonadota bacterium]